MSVKPIKLDKEMSDPDFMETTTNARRRERAYLLGLLRTLIDELKKQNPSPDEIYASVELWIINREVTARKEKK